MGNVVRTSAKLGDTIVRTWLLLTIVPDERLYQGHAGYDDDVHSVYHYDNFVPNHKRVAVGDAVLIRDKKQVLGSARIERIEAAEGRKTRHRCPDCNSTKLKTRTTTALAYRCECGSEFDMPAVSSEPCQTFIAYFGSTFTGLPDGIAIETLWSMAPRLNKQHAMLELDSEKARSLIVDLAKASGHPDEIPVAGARTFSEGGRTIVTVDRAERNPRARKACIDHHGCACSVCGFRFEDRYGAIGSEVIEVHHLRPLSGSKERLVVDPVKDMRPLCSNCHTIVHRTSPPMTMEALRIVLAGYTSE